MSKLLLKLVSADTIAAFIAELVTKALAKIKDKEKAALVSVAVAQCGNAVSVCGKAVEDCNVTDEEVNQIAASVESAVRAIINASK